MKFNAKDLDQQSLLARAREEAQLIYNKPSTRRDRTLENIVETVLYGHVAEKYLIDYHGFSDDPRPYKDVINTNGDPVEVKVTEGDYYVPYVLERAEKAASESWRKYPKLLYIFIGNKNTLDYELHSIYEWNGQNFCLQDEKVVV